MCTDGFPIHIAAFHLELHCQSTPLGVSSIQRANKQLLKNNQMVPDQILSGTILFAHLHMLSLSEKFCTDIQKVLILFIGISFSLI